MGIVRIKKLLLPAFALFCMSACSVKNSSSGWNSAVGSDSNSVSQDSDASSNGANSSVFSSDSSSQGSSEDSSSENGSSSSESNGSISSQTSSENPSRYYVITWENYDGAVLEVDYDVPEGAIPTYDGETPIRPSDGQYDYTWRGWSPAVVSAFSDATYKAVFDSANVAYTISFDLNGGSSRSYNGSIVVESLSKSVLFFDVVKEGFSFRGWAYNGSLIFDEKGNQTSEFSMAKDMLLVAQFSQTAKMSIVKNMDEAGTVSGEGEYPYNTYVDVSATPNQGYEFVGWFYCGELLSSSREYKYMMWSTDVELEARFEYSSYVLTVASINEDLGLVILKNDSGTNTDYRSSYEENRDYLTKVTVAAYTKTEARFLGWFDEYGDLIQTDAVYQFSMPSRDYHIEAKWNYFTISYELNGGTNDPENPTYYTMDMEDIPLKEPTRNGYTFVGWKRSNYIGSFIEGQKIQTSWIDNITLVAIWETNVYQITYELNGGINNSLNPSNYTIETNDIVLKDPSKNGYTFKGWYTESTFKNKITKIYKGSTGDLSLFAKWTITQYSITYILNSGSNSTNNPSTYDMTSEFLFEPATRVGYTFLGWYDENDNQIEGISAGTTGAIKLIAKWNDGNEYAIILNANGGNVQSTSLVVQYNHAYTIPTPTKNGYTFLGWYQGTSKFPQTGTWRNLESITLEAKWEIIVYSITYELNGGILSGTNPTSFTIETDFVLISPIKDGYTFQGWFDKDGSKIINLLGIYRNLSLFASWQPVLQHLSVSTNNEDYGTVNIVKGSGYSNERITVKATPRDGCMFYAWYSDGEYITEDLEYTFSMPKNDYNLEARFGTIAEYERKIGISPSFSQNGDLVTYGLYPQTLVNDPKIINLIQNNSTQLSNGWRTVEKKYYAKVKAKPYSYNSPTFTDNSTNVIKDTTYWFECEPITWRVLQSSNGNYYLLSQVCLDASPGTSSTWTSSKMRTFLNNDFYNNAFFLNNELIVRTTNYQGYYDYAFLPTYDDYLNSNFGFSNLIGADENRICSMTDYSIANGVWNIFPAGMDSETKAKYKFNAECWTRSKHTNSDGSSYGYVWKITYKGELTSVMNTSSTQIGVRPCINISINS